jgi:uncharacterized protein
MIMEIGWLKLDPGAVENFDFTFKPADSGEDCILLTPVHAVGTVTFGGNEFLLEGRLTAEARLPCSRCLAPVDQVLSFDFKEEYEEQEFPGEDAMIDLADIASQIWLTSIPMQTLCQEGCKGLCPRCGKNLNEGECGCLIDEPDPRLEALRNFLNG